MRIARLLLFIAWVWWPVLATAQHASDPPKIAGTIVRFCARGGHIEAAGEHYLLVSSLGVGGILTVNQPGLAALRKGTEGALRLLPPELRVKANACLMPLRGPAPRRNHAPGLPTGWDRAHALSKMQEGELSPKRPIWSFDLFGGPSGFASALGSLTNRFSEGQGTLYAIGPNGTSTWHHPYSWSAPQTTRPTFGSVLILASRAFAGPDQYPPRRFAAYGIVAFPSRAMDGDTARYRMICNAYVASLTFYGEVPEPIGKQMVTVWPVENDDDARRINAMPRGDGLCETAVRDYGMATALDAIGAARLSRAGLTGLGPFLLAWSPSTQIGRPDALVLVSNLSDVTTFQQAKEMFLRWRRDIVENPDLWKQGWDMQKVRIVIQLWSDKYGTQILKIFGIASK